ncbi:adenylate kinase [Nesidiocoris tenuis]|uniref:Adenylate kinase n=1 Tax=Nesidiocoris tenuis TaxID=355587 RepID=A0ABN7AB79_9HEMI|nr:adenylate kinase [Nesidiocoris tenuis]
MGCGYTKDHPKNADLIKLKKKYEADGIKSANLLHIWVVGASKTKSLQLAEKISTHQNYLLLTEDILLQKELAAESERASIVKEILDDKGVICPGIILDLVVECILERLDEIKGVVYHGIPRDREQALHLQRLVGPVSLVIYCELKGESLRAAMTEEGEEPFIIRHKVNQFEKSVLQISKHKTTMTVDGEKDANDLINECLEMIEKIATDA